MKINKLKMIISSILIILPTIITAIFSKKLDGMIAIHWGFDLNADSYTSPVKFVLLFPVFLIIIQFICVLVAAKTDKQIEQNKKVTEIAYWICPVISIYVSVMMISLSLGYEINILAISSILFAIMFIFIGNYMPKCKQNSTMGIKIKWTLTNEENWNLTHRFAGKVWVIGGLIMLFCAFLPEKICLAAFLLITLTMIILPTAYSYKNYRTQIREGRATKKDFEFPKKTKIAIALTTAIIVILLIIMTIITATGEVKIEYNESAITINSTYYSDISIKLDNIKDVCFTDNLKAVRISGFGSPRLSLGLFKSSELGNITCYCYTQNKSAVIIKTNNDALIVVNQADFELTKELYKNIANLIGKAE